MGTIVLDTGKPLHTPTLLRKALLICGILSSLWYIVINIITPVQYAGYSVASQTVSELSAIDAPTRTLWVVLCIFFTLLLIAFGWGVWLSAGDNKKLRVVAAIIVFDAVFGFFWPPMHQREVIAAGGGTLTDTLHLVWAFGHLILMLLMIGFGAAALGKKFRIYSIATVVIFLVFGLLTTMESSGIEAGKPTPYIGIWERINIGAYMLWIVVFAIVLLQGEKMRNTMNAINA
ncbi:DUF998 domain-containing protein [Terrimonas alba]|uniref:DUF998 domain-containing protein n=1 Tax=Terrimonas alba TaxID=3349636 RepID=UPI0035F246AF